MSGDGAYAPPGKARSCALLASDEDDKQAAALVALADVLASARAAGFVGDFVFAWSIVGSANVSVRLLAIALRALSTAKEEAERFGAISEALTRAESRHDWSGVLEVEDMLRTIAASLKAKDDDE